MTPPTLPRSAGSSTTPAGTKVALAVLCGLAGGFGASLGGCSPTLGQTGVVVSVTTQAPIDCVVLTAQAPGGTAITQDTGTLAAKALDDFKAFGFKALIYSGDKLGEGAVDVT